MVTPIDLQHAAWSYSPEAPDNRPGEMTRQRSRQSQRRAAKGPSPYTKSGPNRKQRRSRRK